MKFQAIFFATAALFSFAAAHRIVDSDVPPPRPPPPLPDAVSGRRTYRRDANPYLRARELYDLYERGLDEELAARDAEFDDWY